jgi:hypothetical protein
MILRIAITSRSMTPDLYEIMKVIGNSGVIRRLKFASAKLRKHE